MPELKNNQNVDYGRREDQRTGDSSPTSKPAPLHSPAVVTMQEDGRNAMLQRMLRQVEESAIADRAMIAQLFSNGATGKYEARTTLLRLPKTERERMETWGRK